MNRTARRHPVVFTLVVLILSPYLIAICGIFIVAWVIATALDALGGRDR